MQCRSPRYLGKHDMIVACNNCYCCRVNRKRVWKTRIMLEAQAHKYVSFVTLTYANSTLPTCITFNGKERGTLYPRDLQLFFKRLRRYAQLEGHKQKIRYYAVGEYGDRTWRPHYHICLFGLDHRHQKLIDKAWNKGLIHVGSLTPKSAGYVVGYCEKKMTNPKDKRLFGRHPEFTRSSNRAGIAYNYVEKFVNSVLPHKRYFPDAPSVTHICGQLMPLGRYLKNKIRLALWGFTGAPPIVMKEVKAQLVMLKEEFINSISRFVNFNAFLADKYRNCGVVAEELSTAYRLKYRSL